MTNSYVRSSEIESENNRYWYNFFEINARTVLVLPELQKEPLWYEILKD